VDAVERLIEQQQVSKSVLQTTMKALDAKGEDYSPIEKLCLKKFSFGLNNRSGPRPGEKKPYLAQEVRGKLFLKIPLDTIKGVKKGMSFLVHFHEDEESVSFQKA
jgi:hypothetical protein